MADFHGCIDNALIEGLISREESERLHEAHRRNEHAQGGLGLDDSAAAQQTFDAFAAELAVKRRQKLLGVKAQQRVAFDMRTYTNELGRGNLEDGARALLDSGSFGGKTQGVQQLQESIRGKLHSSLARAFEKFERDILGNTRNKATLSDTVDAMFGATHVPEGAKQIATAIRIAMERARLMFNDAGGHIAFREDFGMPTGHDWERVADAKFEAWRDFIAPLLDRAKMIDGRHGKVMSDAELELALKDVFEAISTEGWSRRDAGGQVAGRAIGNRRADHRFLHFKGGAEWRAYMERFGEGDPFKILNDYLDSMARDIALMQRFGPNPGAGLEYAKQVLQREAALKQSAPAKLSAELAVYDMETMYRIATGQASIPANKAWASAAGEVRQWLVSAQLGGAMLSAITDVGFQQITAAHAGLPGWRVIVTQLALMNPKNAADRETAIALGLIADEASQVMSAQQRHYGEAWGSGLSQRFADGVLKASGLSAWTQAGRWAFGMEFLAFLGRNSDQAFGALPAKLRKTMEAYGFNAATWDQVRASTTERKGARFVDPIAIEDDALGLKLLGMIRGETHFAVPSVSLYGRAALGGGGRAGTVAGELTRSFMMYKNFGVTLLLTHGRRTAMQTTWHGKIGYGGALIGTATVLGGLSLQLKEIAKGRDPRPMGDEKTGVDLDFIGAAMAQGGGFGIFGDFLFSDVNRFGGGIKDTIAGPVAGAINDTLKFTVGNATELMQGKDTKAGSELVDLLGRYTPGGSLWYARSSYERMVLDQLRKAVDPDADERNARLEKRYRRDNGQDFWWAPGQALPSRAPDPMKGFEAAPEN